MRKPSDRFWKGPRQLARPFGVPRKGSAYALGRIAPGGDGGRISELLNALEEGIEKAEARPERAAKGGTEASVSREAWLVNMA